MHTDAPQRRTALLGACAVIAAWGVLFLPHCGTGELVNEEGRRLLPALDILATGKWIVPTIWDRPYLSKPPLLFWILATLGDLAGGLTPGLARVPSLLATLGSALLVHALALRTLGTRSALFGGLAFLILPLTFEKGGLAELEALLTFLIFLATVLWWQGGRARVALAGVVLGAATLTKGPAATMFFAAALLGAMLVERERWRRHLITGLVVVGTSALIGGLWAWQLFEALGSDLVTGRWTHEVTGGAPDPWSEILAERCEYVGALFAGLLPCSLMVACTLGREGRRRWREPRLLALALATTLLGALFFLVFPRSQARYAYPVAPWLALLAGHLFATEGLAATRFGRRLRAATLGTVAALGLLGPPTLLADRFVSPFLGFPVDGIGWVLAGAGALAAFMTRRSWRSRDFPKAFAWAFLVVVSLRAVQLTQGVPARADHDRHRLRAEELAAVLPPEAPLFIASWGDFNMLGHLGRRPHFTEAPDHDVPAGGVLLLEAAQADPLAQSGAWSELYRLPLPKHRALLVWRRLE